MAQTIFGDGNVTASGMVRGDTVRAASLAKYEIGTTTKTSDLSQELASKLTTSSGDASVGWNEDDNLEVSGGKFVGSFDGEFMAAAWNDYKIDLGGGETADLPYELAAQIGNHNTAVNAHSTKFAEKQDAISDLSTIRSGAAAGATAVQSFSSVGGVTPTVTSGVANLSSLFTSDNASYDAANINYTATGETATTVKAKIQAIETSVGTANASLNTALGTAAS